MKVKNFIICCFILINVSQVYSQQRTSQIIKDYNSDTTEFSNRTLNYLFKNYLGGYISSIDVPSTRSIYASIDDSDKSLSLGFVANDLFRNKDYNFHRFQTQLAFKSKGNEEDEFYTYVKDGNLVKSLGVELNQTLFFRGKILGEKYLPSINNYRKVKIKNKLKTLINEGLKKDSTTLNNKIAELEVENIIESGYYVFFHKNWLNFKAFIPVSPIEYKTNLSEFTVSPLESEFRNWSISLSYNHFFQHKKIGAYLYNFEVGVLNRNNIITKDLSKKDFYTLTSLNNNFYSGEKNTYYIGNFQTFSSINLSSGISSMFLFNKSLGLSARIETFINENENTINWTLGIPFALRGKDAETPVSFELQWKEVNKTHYLGISTGISFGEKK